MGNVGNLVIKFSYRHVNMYCIMNFINIQN